MVGHPVNRFTNLSEREETLLICGICLNIFKNAIKTECEHTFCKTCLKDCITKGKQRSCPECRRPFPPRKRSAQNRDDPNVVLIGNIVFKRNLMANSFIDKLEIKCDFESNGCKQVLKFGSLEAHKNECEHRLCSECDLILGDVEQHNCVELLVNDRNRLKQELNQSLDEFSVYKEVVKNELKNNDFKDKVSKLESELKYISDKQKDIKKERNDLKSKFESLSQINKQLEDRLSKQQQLVNGSEIIRKELEIKNSKLELQLSSVDYKLKIQEKERNDFHLKYESLLETNKELDNQLAEEVNTCEQLRTDYKILNDKNSRLESQLNVWRNKYRNLFLTKLKQILKTNKKAINEWIEKYKNLSKINNQLKSDNNNCEEYINNFLSLMTQFGQQNDSKDNKVEDMVPTERRRRSCAKLLKSLEILDKNYRFEEQMKKNNQIIENKNQLIENHRNEVQYYLSGLLIIGQRFCPSIEFIRFGTFNTSVERLLMFPDCLSLISVEPNSDDIQKYNVSIRFDLIEHLAYCNDQDLGALFIKPKTNSCVNVQQILGLDHNSPNDYKFDVNSKDPKESYIVIAFGADAHIFEFCIRYLKLVKPPISFRQIKSDSNSDVQTEDQHLIIID